MIQHTFVGSAVERIAGHNCSTVQVGGQHKGDTLNPIANCLHFLLLLVPSRRELVGKVSIQVNTASIESASST